ncbi:unnamed protein product, partial [Closterium sp. NIES-54]
DGSYDLYTWNCNQNGVPFSNAVFRRLIAASFRRDGEDVLVLKLKHIAFWLYGAAPPSLTSLCREAAPPSPQPLLHPLPCNANAAACPHATPPANEPLNLPLLQLLTQLLIKHLKLERVLASPPTAHHTSPNRVVAPSPTALSHLPLPPYLTSPYRPVSPPPTALSHLPLPP